MYGYYYVCYILIMIAIIIISVYGCVVVHACVYAPMCIHVHVPGGQIRRLGASSIFLCLVVLRKGLPLDWRVALLTRLALS